MKKLLVVLIALFLAAGSTGVWAKGFSSGRSFGSSSFKSIQSLRTTPSVPSLGSTTLPQTRSTTVIMPGYSPPMFFWFPWGGGGNSAQSDGGGVWILVLIIGGVMLFFLFRSRRTVVAEGADRDEEELELFYDRCNKNLNHLANTYVEAQTWLERLHGKIPSAQYKDWNDRYTKISIADFTKQLEVIRAHLDKGEHVAARALLFSFDDDAVAVFDFLQEIENAVEDLP